MLLVAQAACYAELIPVLFVRGDPTCRLAISQTKYEMEPWRFVSLAGNIIQKQPKHVTNSMNVPPSQPENSSFSSIIVSASAN
ncbi:hypothetical protein PS6_000331 [Mucor atramentarius]